jgi:hypothetical protein
MRFRGDENPDMADSTQVAVLAVLNIANEYHLLTKNKARKRRRQTAHP